LSGLNTIPHRWYIVANRANASKTGDDYAFRHASLLWAQKFNNR
jgi:hypothetical protein